MEAKKFLYPLTILESHLDTFGHVNNSVYLQLFEEARWEFITANGFGLNRIQETGLGPVILEITVKYRKELRLRQRVTVESQFLSYQRRVADLHQEIKDESGMTYCTAEFKIGFFDLRARKLILPSPEWLKAIGVLSNT